MKKINIILIVLIVLIGILIILNIRLGGKVNTLENDLNYLQSNISRMESNITSVPSQVSNVLNQMKEEQSWISPIRIDVENEDNKNLNLKASWQIKDYRKGSTVLFHYRTEGEEFKAIEATDKGGGFFEVVVPMEIKLEPVLYLNISQTQEQATAMEVTESSPQRIKGEENTLAYYISVENNDNIRSNEIEQRNLDGFSKGVYGNLQGSLHISNDKIFNVSVRQYWDQQGVIRISSATLKEYKNDELVSTNDLEQIPEEKGIYHVTINNENQEFNRLVLDIEFEDGTKLEEEIYRKH